jgi:hypothetical protein
VIPRPRYSVSVIVPTGLQEAAATAIMVYNSCKHLTYMRNGDEDFVIRTCLWALDCRMTGVSGSFQEGAGFLDTSQARNLRSGATSLL